MSNTSKSQFPGQPRLVARLASSILEKKSVNFLLGSALTAPDGEKMEAGVPGVAAIIKRVENLFHRTPEASELSTELSGCSSDAARYQTAMEFLLHCRGQLALNEVIRDCVLEARTGHPISEIKTSGFEKLDQEVSNWHLRSGIRALGELVHEFPESFTGPILTTNFDPLIEISIRKAGGQAQSVFLTGDGAFDNVAGGNLYRVVHFHGYWHGSDTLHTPSQLSRIRPKLEGCLRDHLSKGVLVVVGYGGWDDVFSQTLLKVVSEGRSALDIIWCFYSSDDQEILNRSQFFNTVAPVLNQGMVVYKGIDCHSLFPEVLERVRKETVATQEEIVRITPRVSTQDTLTSSDEISIAEHTEAASYPINDEDEAFECDSPPSVSSWIGRSVELDKLADASARVVAITGMGGKGKSMLASKYIKHACEHDSSIFWDWRDLHEEGNTIHSTLVTMICRVTKGRIRPRDLNGANIEYVVKKLLKSVNDAKWLFVLDNVDHYIDLENSVATVALHALIRLLLESDHAPNARLIITCRPSIDYAHSRFLEIPLQGFSQTETENLFRLRNVCVDGGTRDDIHAIHVATDGHPLWINIIATQVGKGKAQLKVLLDKLLRGKGTDLPLPMLKSIWNTLNEKQQFILRCMAELTTPAGDEQLSKYLAFKLNWNQYLRAIKALRSLNLVIVKSTDSQSATEKFELHPLIREFIKSEYSMSDRQSFIAPIVDYFRGIIARIMPSRTKSVRVVISMNDADSFVTKSELEANLGMLDQAIETIQEARDSLIRHGLRENYIRIADKIISQFDWSVIPVTEEPYYRLLLDTVNALSEQGRFLEADSLLKRIEKIFPGKNLAYAKYCTLRCHCFWLQKDFEQAIYWGEEAMNYLGTADLSSRNDTMHTLALAKRDAGRINEALDVFLAGQTLASVLAGHVPNGQNAGSFYGNIGRCLFLQEQNDDKALFCYAMSARSLEQGTSLPEVQNRGYASMWIAQVLDRKQDTLNAFLFYRLAYYQFVRFLPMLADEAADLANGLVSKNSILIDLHAVEEWRILQNCQKWINEFLATKMPNNHTISGNKLYSVGAGKL